MKKYTTAERLKQIMQERNMKQVDILEFVLPVCKKYGLKMNKSDISQYVSGKVEPNQRKLVALAEALNVSETWLMGYESEEEKADEYGSLIAEIMHDSTIIEIVKKLKKLQQSDKEKVADYIDYILSKGKKEDNV